MSTSLKLQIVSACLLACLSPVGYAQSPDDGALEAHLGLAQVGEQFEPPRAPAARLTWSGLEHDDGEGRPSDGRLMLVLTNDSKQALSVALVARADAGALENARLELGTLRLAPGQTATVPVALERFGLPLAGMRYAGHVHVSARLFGPQGELEPVIAPFLYFHPAGHAAATAPGFVVYRESALAGTLRGGDFAQRTRALGEPGTLTDRVLDARGPRPTMNTPARAGAAANLLHAYRTCIRWEVETVDSGFGIASGGNAGGTEDQYVSCNAGCTAIARGVRVQVSTNNGSQTYDADPTTGCFDWSHSSTGGFDLRVYGFATDSDGNQVRIHNGGSATTGYPGQTYSILLTDVTPTPNGTDTYDVGNYDRKWTAMAVLGFAFYRYHSGLSDTLVHAAMDDSECWDSSAHYGSSNAAITEGKHYIRIGNCPDGTPSTRRKFVITHELGHALAALYYGAQAGASDGGEPGVSSAHNVGPSACTIGSSYSIDSKEWNSIGFREGFAHFVAARVWNNKHPEGAFRWSSTTHDLERWGQGAGTASGGRLENQCCVSNCGSSWTNAGTIEDWMRFFWDFYNNVDGACPQQPDGLDMFKLYAQTRLNGGLSASNYYDKMRAAAQDIDLPVCLAGTRFDAYAAHNGIDN
jgi:hypothetical protein